MPWGGHDRGPLPAVFAREAQAMRIAGNPAADIARIEVADIQAIRRALEEARVVFIDENRSGGRRIAERDAFGPGRKIWGPGLCRLPASPTTPPNATTLVTSSTPL
jgi:hypothetical protein